jgi:hypothetical protein
VGWKWCVNARKGVCGGDGDWRPIRRRIDVYFCAGWRLVPRCGFPSYKVCIETSLMGWFWVARFPFDAFLLSHLLLLLITFISFSGCELYGFVMVCSLLHLS